MWVNLLQEIQGLHRYTCARVKEMFNYGEWRKCNNRKPRHFEHLNSDKSFRLRTRQRKRNENGSSVLVHTFLRIDFVGLNFKIYKSVYKYGKAQNQLCTNLKAD